MPQILNKKLLAYMLNAYYFLLENPPSYSPNYAGGESTLAGNKVLASLWYVALIGMSFMAPVYFGWYIQRGEKRDGSLLVPHTQ